jgi:hypothetical protein
MSPDTVLDPNLLLVGCFSLGGLTEAQFEKTEPETMILIKRDFGNFIICF